MNVRIALALLVTMILWSSAFAAIRGALQGGYDPLSLATLRFSVASLVLGVYALISRMRMPPLRDLPAILVIGFFGVTLYHVLLNLGERTVASGVAAFLINTVPVFAALIARFYLKERLRLWGWIGILVSFAGVLLTALGRLPAQKDSAPGAFAFDSNALLIVGSALSSAIYLVLHKPYLSRYTAAEFATYMIWAGTLLLLVFAPQTLAALRTAKPQATWLVVYLGVFPAAIAYVTWTYIVSQFPVSRAVTFTYLIPPLAAVFGWILLGEEPGALALLGGVLALTGVIIVNRLGKEPPPPPPPPGALKITSEPSGAMKPNLVVRQNSNEGLKGVKQPATGLFHAFQLNSVGPLASGSTELKCNIATCDTTGFWAVSHVAIQHGRTTRAE